MTSFDSKQDKGGVFLQISARCIEREGGLRSFPLVVALNKFSFEWRGSPAVS